MFENVIRAFFFFLFPINFFIALKRNFQEKSSCNFQSSFSFGEELMAIEPNQDAYQEQELLGNFGLKQKEAQRVKHIQ